MRPISYTRATDVASAITTVSADPQRAFLAGGTTEIDLLRLNVVQPSGLVDINLLPLKQIEELFKFSRYRPQKTLRIQVHCPARSGSARRLPLPGTR